MAKPTRRAVRWASAEIRRGVQRKAVAPPVGLRRAAAGSSGLRPKNFIKLNGMQFDDGGKRHVFVSTNLWQGMNLAADLHSGDPARLLRELDRLQAMWITNVRVMASSDDPDSEPYRMSRALMTAPGKYNEAPFRGLDVLRDALVAPGMRAVMCLNNYWHWSGGMVNTSVGRRIPRSPTRRSRLGAEAAPSTCQLGGGSSVPLRLTRNRGTLRRMQAAICERYGTVQAIELRDIGVPNPAPGEVLVRVHAASVNSWDWDRLTGVPLAYRLLSGPRRPKHIGLGGDYAGRVESIGAGVKGLAPGDPVFGDLSTHRWGAFAEYVCAPVGAATAIPVGITFEQAAALPQAGALAMQGLRALALNEGNELLINGGGGGTGALAIQLAKRSGLRVTAVDRSEKLDLMRRLGAERVVDFAREDFAIGSASYDGILDVSCHRSLRDYRRVMKKEGRYAMLGGDISRILELAALMALRKLAPSGHHLTLVGVSANADNAELAALAVRGELSPVIDRAYSLQDTAAALQRIGDGQALGKLVIHVHEAQTLVGA